MLRFLPGSVFYITRRVAGTLILCMVLHAWIDVTTLGFGKAAADAKSPFTILGFAQYAPPARPDRRVPRTVSRVHDRLRDDRSPRRSGVTALN